MSTSSTKELKSASDLSKAAAEAYAAVRAIVDSGESAAVGDDTVQKLLTAAVRLYVTRRSDEADLPPFLEGEITATDVSITTTAMLDAVDLQLFELTLWHGWGRP